MGFEILERRLALAVTMEIDPTALGLGPNYGVWLAGTANADSTDASKPFKWLDATTLKFVAPSSPTAGAPVPLLPISSPTTITFDGSNDLSGRLTIFVGAIASPPSAPTLTAGATSSEWGVFNPPTAPYLTKQTITDYGTVVPFDIVEFTYLNAAADNSTFNLSQVDGFGLPLTLSSSAVDASIGVQTAAGFSRGAIGDAFASFVTNDPQGMPFQHLIYGPHPSSPFVKPPETAANQFFAIVSPNDWLKNQKSSSPTPSTLLDYWDTTLADFFSSGKSLSINLSASPNAPNIWEGSSSNGTYTLTNLGNSSPTNPGASFQFTQPAPGLESAEYVFGNVFPAGAVTAGDAGLLQDNIWGALNRGVAQQGVLSSLATPVSIEATPTGATQDAQLVVTITTSSPHGLVANDVVFISDVAPQSNQWFPDGYNGLFTVSSVPNSNKFTYLIPPTPGGNPQPLQASGGGTVKHVGQTTEVWNDATKWYDASGTTKYNTYAKFVHYSTLDGTDSRKGGTPIFINNSAYGFSEDENPNGPYSGGQVPAKFDGTITQGSSLNLRIGPWGRSSSGISVAFVSGDFDGNGLDDVANFQSSGQWQVALTPTTGTPTTVNAGSPWSTAPSWRDFTVIFDSSTNRDVVIARASDAGDGSWWKLSLDGTTWNTTFVGSWGIPDEWVDIVSGDFDGNGNQDIAARWLETGEVWMLSNAAAATTVGSYATKNVLIGQWNPAATWEEVVAGNFSGNTGPNPRDTIAGLEGSNWWLLDWNGTTSSNTQMTSLWSAPENWVDYQVGNFAGAAAGEQIAARSSTSGAWYMLAKNGAAYDISHMTAWNPATTWLNVVSGDFDGNGTADIAGRDGANGNWTVLARDGSSFASTNFEGAWPTSSVWVQAFAGIYNEQSSSPKKFGILGRGFSNVTNTWQKALSSGTAFTSSAAPGYPS